MPSAQIRPKRGPKQTIPSLNEGEIAITNDTYDLFVGTSTGTNMLVGASSFLLRDLQNLQITSTTYLQLASLLTRLTVLGCHPITLNNTAHFLPFIAYQHRLHITLNGLTLSPLYDYTFITDPANEICGINLLQTFQDDDILQVSYIRKILDLPELPLDLVIGLKYTLQNATAESYSLIQSTNEYYIRLDNQSLPHTTRYIGENVDQKSVYADLLNAITNTAQFERLWLSLLNYAAPLA